MSTRNELDQEALDSITVPPLSLAIPLSKRGKTLNGARVHLVINRGWTGRMKMGRLIRESGDALCRPHNKFGNLETTETAAYIRDGICPHCLNIMRRMAKAHKAKDQDTEILRFLEE